MFHILAVPYRIPGSHSWALHVGALSVNGASIVGMALILAGAAPHDRRAHQPHR